MTRKADANYDSRRGYRNHGEIDTLGRGGPRADCPECKGTGYHVVHGFRTRMFRCDRCPVWSWEK